MNIAGGRLLRVSAVCAFAGPPLLLIADLVNISVGFWFEWTIAMWLAMVLLIPAVIAFTYMIMANGSRLALIGGMFAVFGLIAGASMQVLFRVYAVLEERSSAVTIDMLRGTLKLVASTQMIGVAWPLGLIILSFSYLRHGAANVIVPLLLLVGAVAFPIGRIAGSSPAVIISGIMFVAAFGMIGSRLLEMSKVSNEN